MAEENIGDGPAPATIFGTMFPFNQETDHQWHIYKGLIPFFKTMGINVEARKMCAWLVYIGSNTFSLLFGSCSPVDSGNKTYTELCDFLALCVGTMSALKNGLCVYVLLHLIVILIALIEKWMILLHLIKQW